MQYLPTAANAVLIALATLVVSYVFRDKFRAVEARIDRFEHAVGQRFDRVDQRFEQVDRRFEQVDRRFESVHDEIRQVRSEMASLRSDVTRVALAVGAEPRQQAG